MGIKFKIRSFIKQIKYRYFDIPKRLNALVIHVDTLAKHDGHRRAYELSFKTWFEKYDQKLEEAYFDTKKETKLRMEQAKRHAAKTDKKIKELQDYFVERISELEDIITRRNKKSTHLADRLEWALNNFTKIEDVTLLAKENYDDYLQQLKTDISEFKKTDQAVMRLAHLEERITLMEVKHRENSHNGRGEKAPRSARAD